MKRRAEFKLVVLDRDGTINRDSADYIKNADEWRPLPGALEAIAQLTQAGWTVCVATNQSGIGRGLLSIDDLHHIHEKMQREVALHGGNIAGIYFCPHTPEDGCHCRKPKPGLLEEISERCNVDMLDVPVIGDSVRDLQAAAAIGARPILVCTGNGHDAMRTGFKGRQLEVYDDLAAAVAALIADE